MQDTIILFRAWTGLQFPVAAMTAADAVRRRLPGTVGGA